MIFRWKIKLIRSPAITYTKMKGVKLVIGLLFLMFVASYVILLDRVDFLYLWNYVKKHRVEDLEERVKRLEEK